MRTRHSWNVRVSRFADNSVNPIRTIVENMRLRPNPDKPLLALSIGDPTTFGNMDACEEITEAVVEAVRSRKYNGYAPSQGFQNAREAVAAHSSYTDCMVESKDVVLTSGCSQALEFCINVLSNPGQNVLVPRPGFPLYRTIAEGIGVKIKYYDLLPDKEWEVDLKHLENQIDSQTSAIVINNPSNPCGSVYSASHLSDLLHIAARNYVPVIADEIYSTFIFPGETFYPLSSLSKDVPILTCGGITKRFMVPGWRMGWIIIHDKNDIFGTQIRNGLQNLCQRIMGCNTIVQGALPTILNDTPHHFFTECISTVKNNAETAYTALHHVPGLMPIMPAGAMYMMVGIDMPHFPEFRHDLDFVEKLVSEQSVFCLPGKCFEYPNYFRIVLTVPEDHIRVACVRIAEFCCDHYIASGSINNDNLLVKYGLMANKY
ncbi:tyrosine aminotransferase-like [Centruroides vittatus]|uniref:tyrosine aminotransferase-like n=1 Tax=Centruroides vittatus TaxID=120091 RepID=UPI00350EA3FC